MNGPLIVLVEDDDCIREAYAEILELDGYTVQGYRNGKEALTGMASSARPSLILLDWMMPVMNGEQFLSESACNTKTNNSPVVVISAVAEDIARTTSRVRAYVNKPLDIRRLLDTVHMHCEALPC